MGSFRIILADDHVILRQGLKRIIESSSGLKVVGEAGDGLELISLMDTIIPDLVILDISMPNMRGLEAIHSIREKHPEVKVLILTMHKEREYVSRVLADGAAGYLLKEDADLQLFSAIEKIREGGVYLSPSLLEGLAEEWVKLLRGQPATSRKSELLTVREKQIVGLIVEGNSSREISDLLNLSVRTVDRHRANIMGKLGLKNVAELIKYAMREGDI